MPITVESNEIDCGIEGEVTDVVTVGKHNRFVLRVLRGHIQPMHSKITVLYEWKSEFDLMVKVFKNMLWFLMAVVAGTAGLTLWAIQHLTKLLGG